MTESKWPLTLIRRGERVGSSRPDYIWWQELPDDATAESVRSVGYEVVEVVPASSLEAVERQLAIVKQAWCDADEVKIRENTKVFSAATDKRQALESENAELREALEEIESLGTIESEKQTEIARSPLNSKEGDNG